MRDRHPPLSTSLAILVGLGLAGLWLFTEFRVVYLEFTVPFTDIGVMFIGYAGLLRFGILWDIPVGPDFHTSVDSSPLPTWWRSLAFDGGFDDLINCHHFDVATWFLLIGVVFFVVVRQLCAYAFNRSTPSG